MEKTYIFLFLKIELSVFAKENIIYYITYRVIFFHLYNKDKQDTGHFEPVSCVRTGNTGI